MIKRTPSLLLVVPCFNEALRLDREAFFFFLQERPDAALVFVDDGSSDNTARLVDGWARDNPRVRLVRLLRNGGKAEAVRRGVLEAGKMLGPFRAGAYIGYWDADLSAPLSGVDDLRAELETAAHREAAFGARVKLVGRRIERRVARHYLGRTFATVVAVLLNLPFYDTQCGAKLFRHSPAIAAVMDKPFFTKWIFDVEVALRLRLWSGSVGRSLEQCVVEYPLKVWQHRRGSKLGWTDGFWAFWDVFRLLGHYGRGDL